MKHNILYYALAFLTIFQTVYYVDVGDICRAVFGCTLLIMWFWIFRMEK